MGKLNDDAKELLRRPVHGWVTTLRPDGSLHSTVVWVDVDGDDVVFNTAVGRAKERHLRADPRVSVSVLDPQDAFHLVSVSGTARLEQEGADAVIDRLAKKYLNVDSYPYRQPGEQRITVRVAPEQVIYSAGS
ncbi:TIGR03618 family F420-dependent PPOX class oxidoreductase [Planomonospora parontospora]|uniref:TIGR03618 family F420-dependent PPOX class oxidoreductase n=1 Tax=Planomonospora parontospora TaxID=58119 RepID=UPI001671444B|nr:TIGR03618 family F420-dependent PPOX class oxidoreductase [Planomonospora parontospora]GGL54115.1 PPOX class F420-dependent enzyme [Planomonospora parontospora subsp. antibiotica]GII19702.1 PPOX class F420-dependent enzyme [Planomonospora parontospora subsp. antibiotica]